MPWQFSLRTLFLFILALAVVCGWTTNRVRRARLQRHIVSQVAQFWGSGSVWYADERQGDNYEKQTYCWTPEPKSWLRRFLGDEYVRVIHGIEFRDDLEIPDSLLVEISQLPELKFMIVDPKLTHQAGFQRIKNAFPELRIIETEMIPAEDDAPDGEMATDEPTGITGDDPFADPGGDSLGDPFASPPPVDPFAPDNGSSTIDMGQNNGMDQSGR